MIVDCRHVDGRHRRRKLEQLGDRRMSVRDLLRQAGHAIGEAAVLGEHVDRRDPP